MSRNAADEPTRRYLRGADPFGEIGWAEATAVPYRPRNRVVSSKRSAAPRSISHRIDLVRRRSTDRDAGWKRMPSRCVRKRSCSSGNRTSSRRSRRRLADSHELADLKERPYCRRVRLQGSSDQSSDSSDRSFELATREDLSVLHTAHSMQQACEGIQRARKDPRNSLSTRGELAHRSRPHRRSLAPRQHAQGDLRTRVTATSAHLDRNSRPESTTSFWIAWSRFASSCACGLTWSIPQCAEVVDRKHRLERFGIAESADR